MAEFKLKTGEIVVVDDEDFSRVIRLKWHIGSTGYVKHSYRKAGKVCSLYLHKFILPGKQWLDHRDGDTLNNRKRNLRPVNWRNNAANARKQSIPCSSRFKGVYWSCKGHKWCAQIGVPRKHLGSFSSEIDAAKAYDAMAVRLYGAYARLNLPRSYFCVAENSSAKRR